LIQVNLVTLISQCIPPPTNYIGDWKLDDGWICRHQMGPSVMSHTFHNGFVLWCYVMPPFCTLFAAMFGSSPPLILFLFLHSLICFYLFFIFFTLLLFIIFSLILSLKKEMI
jgi:hypothetical protein